MIKSLFISILLLLTCFLFAQKDDLNTRFLEAVNNDSLGVVKLYFKKGANVNYVDSTGRTPLHWASGAHLYKIAEFLIRNGATINVKDREGSTPLMYTGETGDLRICYLLFKNGADFKPKDSFGKTALDYANTEGYIRVAEFLANTKTYTKNPTCDELSHESFKCIKNQDYQNAILFGEKALEVGKKELNIKNSLYLTLLKNLAYLYKQRGFYIKAEPVYLEIIKICKSTLGETHPEYASSLNNLADLYQKMEDYNKAEPLFIEALKIRKSFFGENHPDYAFSLSNLAFFYKVIGNYRKAEPLYIEALNVRRIVLGETHPDYGKSLNRLAVLYALMGNYMKCEPLYINAMKIFKNNFGENNSDYANTMRNLAALYKDEGMFSKAEPLYLEGIKIHKIILGENDPEYANSLDHLATLYVSFGNYSSADSLFTQALKIRKTVLGETSFDYAISLKNLAYLNHLHGNDLTAESQYIEAMKICKMGLGESQNQYANLLGHLANLYISLGNYPKAEKLIIEGMEIRKSIFGENHPDYAASLNSLAVLYVQMENFTKAKPLYLEALKIQKTVFGETHPSYALSLNNLAELYRLEGNFDSADQLFNEALKIRREVFGKTHPDYAESLHNLAYLYKSSGNYSKSEQLFLEAIEILKAVLGKTQPNYVTSLKNLANLYERIGKYYEAEPIYIETFSKSKEIINNNFSFLSDQERLLFWITDSQYFDITYPSFTYNYYPQKPSISTFAYDNALFTKGLLLNTSLQIQNAVLQSGDIVLINIWENLRGLKRQINVLQSKPIVQQGDLQVFEIQADSLDKVLTQKSQLYKQSQSDMQVKWTDVQKNLQPDEAAIEFISFNYFNKQYTDSTMYCALVLKKDSEYPEMIPLFEEKQLDSLFVKSSSDVNQLYTYRVTNLRKDTVESRLNYGSKLFNLLWKPLEASLKNTKTVYYAPSGKLNQVAFAAIPVDSTLLLSEKYNLHQLTSTRQVIKNSNAANKLQEAALFGGIQYELDNKQLAQVQTTSSTNYRSAFVSDSTQRSGSFGYLKGTGEEVTGIAEEFKLKGLTEQLYTGAIASEAAFKKLSETKTDIIHIATHGFYLPIEDTKPKDFKFMSFDNDRRNIVVHNPLLRSGLAFAGANSAWRGDSIPENWEDGILTAHEISQLNLTHTDLVVLSACETALGDVKGSEGVFGLQRAFKMAGVQTLIMSLWKVPDTQTSQLMQSFYKYWLGGMTKHDAFKKAQNEIRKANPNPYYWAAFVMVD